MDKIPINYCDLEKDIQEIVDNNYRNNECREERNAILDIVDKFRIPFSIIKKEIIIRRKENKRKKPRIKTYIDLPYWEDKSRCPLCNSKLVKKWEGLVCINNCPLNFKCAKGWVYLQRDSGWSNSRRIINGMFGCNRRNYLQQQFCKLKRIVLVRDNYKCRMCDYSLKNDFNFTKGLEVHHIIPASEEMALYLDKDNLITLCKDCHKKIHSEDKYNFSGSKE